MMNNINERLKKSFFPLYFCINKLRISDWHIPIRIYYGQQHTGIKMNGQCLYSKNFAIIKQM